MYQSSLLGDSNFNSHTSRRRMRRQVHRNRIRLYRSSGLAHWIERDGELFGGHVDAEESRVLLVVFVQLQAGGLHHLAAVHVTDVDVVSGFGGVLAKAGVGQRADVVAAISADDEGHAVVL